MINAIAIDDEPPALDVLTHYCSTHRGIRLKNTFTSGSAALNYIRNYPVDVVFLDMQMPGMSGMEFCERAGADALFVFTSAYSHYAVEGFNLNVIDFLHKPYSQERFEEAVVKIQSRFERRVVVQPSPSQPDPSIFLRTNYSLARVALDQILYVEGFDDASRLYFRHGAPMLVRMSLKALLEKLPPERFIRVHRSYIVPVDKVDRIRSNKLFIGGKEIQIGRIYKPEVSELLRRQ